MTTRFLVTRGTQKGIDPVFAGTAHSVQENCFCVIKFRGDRVADRQIFPAAQFDTVHLYLKQAALDGAEVLVDDRTDASLTPRFSGFRSFEPHLPVRAKSDSEFERVFELDKTLWSVLSQGKNDSAFRGAVDQSDTFRGAAETAPPKHFYQETDYGAFRGVYAGIQCAETGLMTSQTAHVVKPGRENQEWRQVECLYRALNEVKEEARIGKSVADMDQELIRNFRAAGGDLRGVKLEGPCARQTGWAEDEAELGPKGINDDLVIENYDRIKFCAMLNFRGSATQCVYVDVGSRNFPEPLRFGYVSPAPEPPKRLSDAMHQNSKRFQVQRRREDREAAAAAAASVAAAAPAAAAAPPAKEAFAGVATDVDTMNSFLFD